MTGLTRWRSMTDLSDLRDRLDRSFEDMFEGRKRDGRWSPSVDVIEKDGNITVRADIPGVSPDDIKVEVEDDVLKISGEFEEEKEDKEENYVRRERRSGSFSRSLALPRGISADDIEAESKDGVLELTVPVPEKEKSTVVNIKPKAKS